MLVANFFARLALETACEDDYTKGMSGAKLKKNNISRFSGHARQAAAGLREISRENEQDNGAREQRLWWEGYCDGSYHGYAQALGVGGHLNGPDGTPVASFSEARLLSETLASGSAHAEYEAAFHMLRLAAQRGVRRLIVKMDNRGVALTLSNQKSLNPEMDVLAQRVLNEAKAFEEVVYQWVPRLKNRVADELSRAKLRSMGLLAQEGASAARGPSMKPRRVVDEALPDRLGARHPGVFHVDRSKALAQGPKEKARAEAQWSGGLCFRTHAAHGEGGVGVAAGAEIYGEGPGVSGAMYSEARQSPALCELKLMLRLLNRAKERGHRRALIETTSQTLSLICSGLREPPPHLRSAVYTLFKKAAEFEKIAVSHRAGTPNWAEQLEREAPLGLGFKTLPEGFEGALGCEISSAVIETPQGGRSLVIMARIDGAAPAIQWRAVPESEPEQACEARCVAQSVRRLAGLGISKVTIRSRSAIDLSVDPSEAKTRSAWAQLKRAVGRADARFERLTETGLMELQERAYWALSQKELATERGNKPARSAARSGGGSLGGA